MAPLQGQSGAELRAACDCYVLSSLTCGFLVERRAAIGGREMDMGMGMGMGVDREEGLNLSLALQPSPSSPPRFQAVFACCYCPRKFRSSQALGGHQNAHKLQRNLARRGREDTVTALSLAAAAVAPGEQAAGKTADVVDDSAPRHADPESAPADAWAGERMMYRHRLQGAAAAAASSGAGTGNGELADEMIDLSLKL